MSLSLSDKAYDSIVQRCGGAVAEMGYTRHAAVLRKIVGRNLALIEFQKSVASKSDHIIFTANAAIVCGELLDQTAPPLSKIGFTKAHLRERIGKFLPGRPDKWWTLEPETDVSLVSDEVSQLLVQKVLPFLDRYVDTAELQKLWRSGVSPGLTEFQRRKYLEQLDGSGFKSDNR